MRFTCGEVWTSTTGRRGVVIAIDDDGRSGRFLFGDNGDENWLGFMELTQAGQWKPDTTGRQTKSAAELKAMLLQKMRQQAACPPAMSVAIVALGSGKWRADGVPPPSTHIAYADCSHYIGNLALWFGLLYDLA